MTPRLMLGLLQIDMEAIDPELPVAPADVPAHDTTTDNQTPAED